MRLAISFLLCFPFCAARAQNLVQNLNISAAVDLVAPVSLDDSANNKLDVRSAEVLFFAPIDQTFDGVLNVAGHNDDGEFHFGLHEAYISTSKLIPSSRIRAGRFFMNVGRLNQYHQHDWPFVGAPKVHREFLNPGIETAIQAESAADTGLEYSWLLPTERFIDVTIGVTNGYCFGHCHGEGEKPPLPVHYVHPTTFFELGDGKGLLIGATYLGRKDHTKTKTDLIGIEATYKNRQGKRMKWLVQSEAFLQLQDTPGADKTSKAGFYVFPQYGLNERWYFGARFDGFSHLNMKFQSNGEKRADFDYAVVPTLSFKNSEFATFRLAYSHEVDTTKGVGDVKDRQVQLQFVYILGAHPAHDF